MRPPPSFDIRAVAGDVDVQQVVIDPPRAYQLKNWGQLSDPQRVAFLRRMVNAAGMDPRIRLIATDIVKKAGIKDRDYPGQVAAILKWVQSNIAYFNEQNEVIQDPLYTWQTRQGDCDDSASLILSLIQSLRLPNKFVLSGTLPNGKKVRWIEGSPFPYRMNPSHIYGLVRIHPFSADAEWVFVETTLKGVKPGWDVIGHFEKNGNAPLPEMAGALGSFTGASAQAAGSSVATSLSEGSAINWRNIGVAVGVGVTTAVISQVLLDYIRQQLGLRRPVEYGN